MTSFQRPPVIEIINGEPTECRPCGPCVGVGKRKMWPLTQLKKRGSLYYCPACNARKVANLKRERANA